MSSYQSHVTALRRREDEEGRDDADRGLAVRCLRLQRCVQGRQVRLKPSDEPLAGLLGERLVRVLTESL